MLCIRAQQFGEVASALEILGMALVGFGRSFAEDRAVKVLKIYPEIRLEQKRHRSSDEGDRSADLTHDALQGKENAFL